VGFGLKNENIDQLKCAAREGEGNYYDAQDSESLSQVLNEAIHKTVDDPTPNFSVYATKNGLPVDAWVRATREGTSEVIDNSRSYQDTAFLFLPPGNYKIEITPLEGTDIPGTSIMVEIKQDAFIHRDISFDGGKITLTTTNNGEPWDAIAKVYNQTDKKVAGSIRTYGKVKGVEVAPGNYFLTLEALNIKGVDIKIEIQEVKVVAGESQEINYNFLSGIAMVGVQTSSGELIDASINFIEVSSGKRVAGSRSYTSASSNPSKFILNPGVYNVKVLTLGKHKGNSKLFTIEVKEGETVEKILTF
jgi:Ca-activated chloride channel family protein